MSEPELHSSIISLISLAAGIASKHPDMGLCQIERLRTMGISESQITTVIDIARHIRDEAAEKIDHRFDQRLEEMQPVEAAATVSCGCSPTPSGQSCC